MSEFSIESGEYGPRMILHGPWRDSLKAIFAKKGIKDLYLNDALGWKGNDLSFLKELDVLEAFKILDWKMKDIAPIHYLNNLRYLHVYTYCQSDIDFNRFKDLEDCGLEWRPKARTISDCTSLRKLFISNFREHDLTLLTNLVNLEELSIKCGSLKSTTGLSKLTNLKFLGLYGFSKLVDFTDIGTLVDLRHLELVQCRKLGNLDIVNNLRNLEILFFDDDGRIESIKPLTGLKRLKHVTFIETTNIADGDLRPLEQLPDLERVSYQNRRHYTHRREDFKKKNF